MRWSSPAGVEVGDGNGVTVASGEGVGVAEPLPVELTPQPAVMKSSRHTPSNALAVRMFLIRRDNFMDNPNGSQAWPVYQYRWLV